MDVTMLEEVPKEQRTRAAGASPARSFTTKQMGDACEMLIAAELTLAGIPALKVPDNWPHYDVIAQPPDGPAQRISVKSRTFSRGPAYVGYQEPDQFDWLAIVVLAPESSSVRTVYLVPREEAGRVARRDKPTSRTANERYFRIDQLEGLFARYRDNFALRPAGVAPGSASAGDAGLETCRLRLHSRRSKAGAMHRSERA
ncbi:hypothetical protein [Tabrizicola soli]|nr:hypothetical protein [Tabrizicola soli]